MNLTLSNGNNTYEVLGTYKDDTLLKRNDGCYVIAYGLQIEDNRSCSWNSGDYIEDKEVAFHKFRENIYREQELSYRSEDAINHLCDYFGVKSENASDSVLVENDELLFTKKDIKDLTEQFLNDYDCNRAENDQWETLICSYVEENEADLKENYQNQNQQYYRSGR